MFKIHGPGDAARICIERLVLRCVVATREVTALVISRCNRKIMTG